MWCTIGQSTSSCIAGAPLVTTADCLLKPPYSLTTLLTALKISLPLVVLCKDTNFNSSLCTSNELSIAFVNTSSWLTSITSKLLSKAQEKHLQSCMTCRGFPSTILNVKNFLCHCATGQRNSFKVHTHVISKCFSHLYCALLHHFSIWQGLCFSKLRWNNIRRPESGPLCSCGSGKKALLAVCSCFEVGDDGSPGSSGVPVVFVCVCGVIVANQIEIFHGWFCFQAH